MGCDGLLGRSGEGAGGAKVPVPEVFRKIILENSRAATAGCIVLDVAAPSTTSPSSNADGFEHDATPVLASVRQAVGQILSSLPEPVSRAYHLVGRLRIDRALAWRMWQVAYGPGALPDPAHIPGKVGVSRFLSAAADAGVRAGVIEGARGAFDRFDRLAAEYGSDRASINVLLSALGDRSQKPAAIEVRRELFRAQSQVLGVQARTLYQLNVVVPGEDGFGPDVVLVRGLAGLHRTRPGVSWVLGRSRLVQTTGAHTNYTRRAIDGPHLGPGEPPLMPSRCSSPLPRVTRHLVDEVTYEDCLEPGPIGPRDAVDIVMGEVITHIPRDVDDHDAMTMRVTTPAERVCFDLLLHRDATLPASVPAPRLYTLVHGDVSFHANVRGELPNADPLIEIGHTSTPPVEGVPAASELVDHAVRTAGRPREQFRHYRFSMRYPPIPLIVAIEYELAPQVRREPEPGVVVQSGSRRTRRGRGGRAR